MILFAKFVLDGHTVVFLNLITSFQLELRLTKPFWTGFFFLLPALPISEHSKGPKKNHLIKNFCMHTQQLFDNHCHWLDNPCYYVKHLQTLITSLWSKVLPASFFLVILVQISITWYTVYRLVPGHHQACNSYWVHKVLHHSIAECPGIYLKKC